MQWGFVMIGFGSNICFVIQQNLDDLFVTLFCCYMQWSVAYRVFDVRIGRIGQE